jgi:hypothetical protein
VNTETKDSPKEKGLWRNLIATCGIIATVLGVVKGFQDQWEWFQQKQITHTLKTYLNGFSLHNFFITILTRVGILSCMLVGAWIIAGLAAIIPAVTMAYITKKEKNVEVKQKDVDAIHKRLWLLFTIALIIYTFYIEIFVRHSHIFADKDPAGPIIGAFALIWLLLSIYGVIAERREKRAESRNKIHAVDLGKKI